MKNIGIKTDFIKLDQFLKWVGCIDRGSDGKDIIKNGNVKVNEEVEVRRGRKLYLDDIVEFQGEKYKIVLDELEEE